MCLTHNRERENFPFLSRCGESDDSTRNELVPKLYWKDIVYSRSVGSELENSFRASKLPYAGSDYRHLDVDVVVRRPR